MAAPTAVSAVEQLEKSVSPSLNLLTKALRTGEKNLFDPTKSTQLFNHVYNITVRSGKKDPREIQNYLLGWCRADLQDNVAPLLKSIPAGEDGDQQLFSMVAREYHGYRLVIKTLRFLFLNTDNAAQAKLATDPKSAAPQQQPLAMSEQCALRAFYDSVFQPVEARLRTSIFVQLDKIRDGVGAVDRNAVRNATSLFERIAKVLCVTSSDREMTYIVSFAKPYYAKIESRVAQDYAEHGSRHGYVRFLLEHRALEADLAKLCLNAMFAPKALEVYDDCAVARRGSALLTHPQFGLEAYLEDDKFNSQAVADLYQLFWHMTPTQPKLLEAFSISFGNSIARDFGALKQQWESSTPESATALAIKVMEDVLALLRKKDLIVKTEFCGCVNLERQRHASFMACLNPPNAQLIAVPGLQRGAAGAPSFVYPQLLAHYVDHTLRELSGSSHNNAADDSGWADPISQLFALVSEKDLFAEYFRLQMARRLLTNYADDNERAVLSRFQRQNGKVYTHKFEGMINDVQQAGALQNEFVQAFPAAQNTGGCEFLPKVLTAAFWPQVRRDESFVPPESLAACHDVFMRFYRRKFPTRQLRWQSERGTAALVVAFPTGSKEIACNIHQATVMIAIDAASPQLRGAGLSMAQLAQMVGLPAAELKPLLASMLFAKGLNVVRRPNLLANGAGGGGTAKLEDSDTFEMNPSYSCRVRKLKLPSATSVSAAQQDIVKEETIDASRAQMLDAAIVRIMKSRKELPLADIVELTLAATMRFFTPQPRQIKKRIEALIQKEFLERDVNQTDVFKYLA